MPTTINTIFILRTSSISCKNSCDINMPRKILMHLQVIDLTNDLVLVSFMIKIKAAVPEEVSGLIGLENKYKIFF